MRTVVSVIVFVVAAVGMWFVFVFASLAVVFAEGGGVSCSAACTPTQDFLNESFPAVQVVWAVICLAAATAAVRRFRARA